MPPADRPGSEGPAAFRVAEKAYQLHKDQQMRIGKNGKRHGGKLVIRPTDFSAVVDLHEATQHDAALLVPTPSLQRCDTQQEQAAPQPARQPGQQEQAAPAQVQPQQWHRGQRAYVFPAHPGLVYFPAALSGSQQLQLMAGALTEYAEPPAHTNHWVAYGPLVGIFQAAQQGLVCQVEKAAHAAPAAGPCSDAACGPAMDGPCSDAACDAAMAGPCSDAACDAAIAGPCSDAACDAAMAGPCVDVGDSPAGAPSSSSSSADAAPGDCGRGSSRPGALASADCPSQAAAGHTADPSSGSTSRRFSECWGGGDGAPLGGDGEPMPAALLLRKLRWACLGPNFNWTRRVYDPQLPHRPLPHELVQLAKQFYDAAIHATQQQQQQQPAPGAACRPPAPAGPALHAACTSASFQPDAAIVNYYYEGDTLGGHRDDAESDMLKPIVTLSLGCDSVFLMGGLTKEVAPTALRLRSGDVLVMGGQARSCYHGLPRVLTDRPLPDEVLAAAQALVPWEAGGQLPAVVQHMQACRVNISIRAID